MEVTVAQDYTNPDFVTAFAVVTHTCFPAHVVKAQGAILYNYVPPRSDPAYIFDCLVNRSTANMTVGLATPLSQGCLTVLGIAAGNHVVGFGWLQILSNSDFELWQDGMGTFRKVLAESVGSFW